jgi:hypothetical protein
VTRSEHLDWCKKDNMASVYCLDYINGNDSNEINVLYPVKSAHKQALGLTRSQSTYYLN